MHFPQLPPDHSPVRINWLSPFTCPFSTLFPPGCQHLSQHALSALLRSVSAFSGQPLFWGSLRADRASLIMVAPFGLRVVCNRGSTKNVHCIKSNLTNSIFFPAALQIGTDAFANRPWMHGSIQACKSIYQSQNQLVVWSIITMHWPLTSWALGSVTEKKVSTNPHKLNCPLVLASHRNGQNISFPSAPGN